MGESTDAEPSLSVNDVTQVPPVKTDEVATAIKALKKKAELQDIIALYGWYIAPRKARSAKKACNPTRAVL